MSWVDFILNLAGLLLWLSWRSVRLDPFAKTTPATLAGTLRRAEPHRLRRWHFLAALGGLLLLRAVLYWQVGSAADWTPNLHLHAVGRTIPFRSDSWWRMLVFSFLSFGATLGLFYLWLLFPSLVIERSAEPDPVQKLVRMQLGRVDRWPWLLRLSLPLVVTFLVWYGVSALLAGMTVIPPAISKAQRFQQAVVVGVGSYLSWEYLIGGLLAIHLVSSYVYLGSQPFWNWVATMARSLLTPLRGVPLTLGKLDFAPLIGLALVFFVGQLAERGLSWLYARVPF
jgi:uncharacterized protein YggT (Ycf19 family)